MTSDSSDDGFFEELERESTLSIRATARIEELILAGRFQPGERLPSERELAARLGVSRTVVREAVRSLVAKDLLEVKAGRGTVVRRPSLETVTRPLMRLLTSGGDDLDYGKIHEIRTLLETEIAGLASKRRTEADLREIEAVLRRNAEIEKDRNAFAEGDVAFHTALARATRNELFSLLLDSVVDIMIGIRQLAFDLPDTPHRAHRYHLAIFEKVRAGDEGGARGAMQRHLEESWSSIQAVLRNREGDRKSP